MAGFTGTEGCFRRRADKRTEDQQAGRLAGRTDSKTLQHQGKGILQVKLLSVNTGQICYIPGYRPDCLQLLWNETGYWMIFVVRGRAAKPALTLGWC